MGANHNGSSKITPDQKQAEPTLRESEERLTFRLRLSDTLRLLSDPI
jgi:hypothetical protein